MAKPGNTGFRRVVNATFYSVAGLRSAWRSEAAFRQECVAVVVLSPVAVWLGQNAVERALLFSSCVLVLIVELLNTAIEFVVDRVGTDHHELSGRAKDARLRRRVHEHRARDAGLGIGRLGTVRLPVSADRLERARERQATHRERSAEQRAGRDVGRIVQAEHTRDSAIRNASPASAAVHAGKYAANNSVNEIACSVCPDGKL